MLQVCIVLKPAITMWSSDEDESDVNINDLWASEQKEEEKDEAKVSKTIKKKLFTM